MFDGFFNLNRNKQVKLLQKATVIDDGRVRLSLSEQQDSLVVGMLGYDCVQITRHSINKKGILSLADKTLYQLIISLMDDVPYIKQTPKLEPKIQAYKTSTLILPSGWMPEHVACEFCGNPQGDTACNSCNEYLSNFM